jgi:Calcium-activated chloride channel
LLSAPLTQLPVQTIRNYFGEEVAFYFAFLQFYTEWCFWICLPATISIIFSFITSSPPDGTISSILSFFDNSYAILFAYSLNVSSLLFLKFWKRRNHYLSFIWDVDYVQLTDSSRIGWKSSSILAYSSITGDMVPFESKKTILMRKSISFFFLSICISFLIMVVGLNVGVQAYLANTASTGIAFLDNLGSLGLSASSSVVAAVVIIILEFAIDKFTLFLIELENHQTISAHLDRYIWIQFLIQFINSFGLMIFLSVIKPVISQTNPSFSYVFGPLLCNSQGTGTTCMQALVLSVAIIFIIQQFTILIFSFCFLILSKRSLKPGKFPNSVDKSLQVITHESFQKEYSSRILQFGTIVLFTSTFPLGNPNPNPSTIPGLIKQFSKFLALNSTILDHLQTSICSPEQWYWTLGKYRKSLGLPWNSRQCNLHSILVRWISEYYGISRTCHTELINLTYPVHIHDWI